MPEKHYLLFLNVSYSFSILRPLQSAIQKRGDVAAWYLHDLNPSHLTHNELLLHSVDEVKRFNPLAVFVPGNWVPDFFPGIKVEIFHGFGIEKKGHFDVRGLFDLYCTHGPLTTRPFEELAEKHGFFHVIETGWPKVDALFQYNRGKSWRETHEIGEKPIVLYAPTFSPSLSSAGALQAAIKELSLRRGFQWIVKFHPLMDPKIVQQYAGMANANLQIIKDPDIIPYLHAADVMLSDTSSVVTEFLLLKKPVVTFRTIYPAASHIINFNQAGDLESTLEYALHHRDAFLPAAEVFANQMHPYFDGRSSERVLDAVDRFIEKHQETMKPKPFNPIRKLKIRYRMKYYHMH